MATYYLDIFDGHEVIRDEEGEELADMLAVRLEAEEAVRELLANTIGRHEAVDSRELRVRDTEGAVVYFVRFVDMLA